MAIGELSAGGVIIGGMIGQRGPQGIGIRSITKTGTQDLVDTYTITYTNNTTSTFEVVNGEKGDTGNTGNGISTITKTSTSGLIDTYTITYTNGDTTTFEVTNGEISYQQMVDYVDSVVGDINSALDLINGEVI